MYSGHLVTLATQKLEVQGTNQMVFNHGALLAEVEARAQGGKETVVTWTM